MAGFRIVEVLDEGPGMGAVYAAARGSADRPVALKLFRSGLVDDERFRKRFAEEIRKLAELDHPHLVPIYEAGLSRHGIYVAMRLVQGQSLDEAMTGDGLEAADAVRLLRSIASALDTAHDHGVLHGDIKPRKILLDSRSRSAFLTGFAVRPLSSQRRSSAELEDSAAYVSPEQVAREPVSARSEVYSLGAVLFEALTGEPPFRGSGAALLEAHAFESPPRVTDRRPDLPPSLDGVLQRALAKDASERQRSAGRLMREVEQALAEPAPDARDAPASAAPTAAPAPSPAPRARPPAAWRAASTPALRPIRARRLAAAGALLFTVIAGVGGWYGAGGSESGSKAVPTTARVVGSTPRAAQQPRPAPPARSGGAALQRASDQAERRAKRQTRRRAERRRRSRRRSAAARRVTLRVAPREPTYVCVDNGAGRVLLERTLERPRRFRGKRLRLNLGRRTATVRVNGRRVAIAPGPQPVGFDFRAGRRPRALATGQRPCA